MSNPSRWWRTLGRRHQRVGAVYVLGVGALVVVGETTDTPLPFLLATLVTLPLGAVAFASVYVAYGLTSQLVAVVIGENGDRHDRVTRIIVAPIYVVLFAAAALVDLWLFDARNRSSTAGDRGHVVGPLLGRDRAHGAGDGEKLAAVERPDPDRDRLARGE